MCIRDRVNTLPEVADPAQWEQAVGQIDGRMRRLEPVNLAAIHECGEAEQRKTYLDAQNTDLTTALETLEEAIRKIDRETRGRFKEDVYKRQGQAQSDRAGADDGDIVGGIVGHVLAPGGIAPV